MTAPSTSDQKKQPSTRRTWTFRLLAIALGFGLLIALELTLRILGPPPTSPPGFASLELEPLFEPVPSEPDSLWIPEKRRRFFPAVQFKREKENALRVFALGGSTTQGEPYSNETAFPQWMGIALEQALDTDVEVINCGGLSYASYRVLAILEEVLEYDPDLIVVYTGHNEYLEKRSYTTTAPSLANQTLLSQTKQLYITRWIRTFVAPKPEETDTSLKTKLQITAEVDALLDYQGGLEDYERDALWMNGVVEHLGWNIDSMVEACKKDNVPLLFVEPVSNLKDCPPFKFETSWQLDASALAEFEGAWSLARESDDLKEARAAVQVALDLDPDHAGVNYLAGQLALARSDFEGAKRFLANASNHDVVPLRATDAVRETIRSTLQQLEVPSLDANELFKSKSENGIVGDRWLVDHIHPSVEGHQILGQEVAARILQERWFVTKDPTWRSKTDKLFSEHISTLGEDYFVRAQQRLEGLRLWTQGRAKKVRE
ncbi:MAG: GDSL-type esterase/lipase family protein [Planctomycetota bacterium]